MVVPRRLNERSLRRHAPRVSIPTYDRAAIRRGVVHLSVGAFHRAHQAVYFDELARRGLGDGWAITGVGLRRRDMQHALHRQDGLYTVVTRSASGDSARVVGMLTRYLYAPSEREAVLDVLADGRTRLVTLTITANGYGIDPEAGGFVGADAGIQHDLAHPGAPRSALGFLVEALARRRRSGLPPFTVLSCDNMVGNGAMARAAVVGMAAERDPQLARWVDEHGAFPASMVDRITPCTTAHDRVMVERTFGIRDRWPVMTEEFSQWVIEDSFCDGRPPLDEVGAQFVTDVAPYSLTKTRLLNGAHCALGYLGSLAGHARLDETMADPVFADYIERMMDEEVGPLLPAVDIDVAAYGASLRSRFANPVIADRLARLCRNGSAKVPRHLLPSIREAMSLGGPYELLTLAVAGWCRYLRGVDESGRRIHLEDPSAERLRALALAGRDDPRALLADEQTFGSLGRCPDFVEGIWKDLRDLEAYGARAVVARRTANVLQSVKK